MAEKTGDARLNILEQANSSTSPSHVGVWTERMTSPPGSNVSKDVAARHPPSDGAARLDMTQLIQKLQREVDVQRRCTRTSRLTSPASCGTSLSMKKPEPSKRGRGRWFPGCVNFNINSIIRSSTSTSL
ncbi:hypothetical protein MCOR17_011779 [Pyricularia oryzae]|nr:hypothetical protein MCOR17_011779 [Pyricularia oryzae]